MTKGKAIAHCLLAVLRGNVNIQASIQIPFESFPRQIFSTKYFYLIDYNPPTALP
jgi:hypothetical protein